MRRATEEREGGFQYHWLEEENAMKQLQLFLSLNEDCNLDAKDEDGNTMLHHACLFKHLNVIAFLLKAGANPNLQDEEGQSPLHKAAKHGYRDVVKLLIDHNSNVNLRDTDGWSPIHFASVNEHKETSKLLVIHGAKYDQRDKKRRTAGDLAGSKSLKTLFSSLCEYKFSHLKPLRTHPLNINEAINTMETANPHTPIFTNPCEFTCYHMDPSKGHIWFGDGKGTISSFRMGAPSPLTLEAQFPVSDHIIHSLLEHRKQLWVSSANKRLTVWDSTSNSKKNEMFYPSKQTNLLQIQYLPLPSSLPHSSSSPSSIHTPSASPIKSPADLPCDQIWALSHSDNSILAWNSKTFNFEFSRKVRVPHLFATKNIQFSWIGKVSSWVLLSIDRWVILYDPSRSEILYSFVTPEKLKGIEPVPNSNFFLTYSSHHICLWEILPCPSPSAAIAIQPVENIAVKEAGVSKVQFYQRFDSEGEGMKMQVFVVLERMLFILSFPSMVMSNIHQFGDNASPLFIHRIADSFLIAVNYSHGDHSSAVIYTTN